MKRLLLPLPLVVILLLVTSPSSPTVASVLTGANIACAGLTWTARTDMPTARWGLDAVTVGGKIYAIGGTTNFDALDTVEAYDPATDTWYACANMPTARACMGVTATDDGKILAIGGIDDSEARLTTVEEYDPATDTWRSRASMPTRRYYVGVATSNGHIYAMGGENGMFAPVAAVEEYDPATDTWRARANMLTPRWGFGIVTASNGHIFAIGGTSGWDNICGSTVEEYDPATDTWTRRADMPTCGQGARTVFAANGKIYAIGRYQYPYTVLATVEEYDPATDTWTTCTSMPTARWHAGVAMSNGRIYVIGGGDVEGGLATVEEAMISGLIVPTATPTSTPSPTPSPTITPSPTAMPTAITQCWVSTGEERVYRVPVAAFVPYDTESASDSPLRRITAPPAPVGWNSPFFQGDDAWESPSAVWWPSWAVGIWARLPEGATPIGVDDGSGQPLGETGLTLLYRRAFTLTPPVAGWVVTQAHLETWSDNKAEWWWQGTSVATDRQGYGGVVALYPDLVQAQGGEYTLAVQNSNDLQAGDNPQGTAYRLCVTWSYQANESRMFVMLPIILKP